MLWIFGGVLVAGLVLAAICVWWGKEGNAEIIPAIGATLGVIGVIVSGILILAYSMALAGAPVKAKLLNESYGTHYTTEDLIWGDDIIKEVIQGKRSRLDVTVEQKN